MSNNIERKSIVRSFPVTLRDKTVTSRTSGSVTASARGRDVTVSNNIDTDVVTEAIIEFPDGGQETIILLNESFKVPVGQKILLCFLKGDPVAYQATKGGRIMTLGYLNEKGNQGFADGARAFGMLVVPGLGTLMTLGVLGSTLTYYKDGQITAFNTIKGIAAASLAAVALATFAAGFWGYLLGNAVAAIPNLIAMHKHGELEDAGRREIFSIAERQFASRQEEFDNT